MPAEQLPITPTDYDEYDNYDYTDNEDVETTRKKHKGRKDKKKPRKYKFKVPDGPSKSSPPGPAYSPQTLTWTRHIQYFANLTHINNDFLEPSPDAAIHDRLSINNEAVSAIFGFGVSPDGMIENKKWNEGKHKKHQGKQPRPEPHPNEFVFEVEYDTKKDRGFKDLTVRRWVEYARKIGASKGKSNDTELEFEEEDVEEESEVEDDVEGEDDIEGEEEDMADEYEEVDENDFVIAKHKKHKHKKGKKGKHHKKHKASKEWYTFVKRAFVGTMDPKELKLVFGAVKRDDGLEEGKENMEL